MTRNTAATTPTFGMLGSAKHVKAAAMNRAHRVIAKKMPTHSTTMAKRSARTVFKNGRWRALTVNRAKLYDPKCHDLAAHFLSDHPEHNTPETIAALAREIQLTIEFELQVIGAMGVADV